MGGVPAGQAASVSRNAVCGNRRKAIRPRTERSSIGTAITRLPRRISEPRELSPLANSGVNKLCPTDRERYTRATKRSSKSTKRKALTYPATIVHSHKRGHKTRKRLFLCLLCFFVAISPY